VTARWTTNLLLAVIAAALLVKPVALLDDMRRSLFDDRAGPHAAHAAPAPTGRPALVPQGQVQMAGMAMGKNPHPIAGSFVADRTTLASCAAARPDRQFGCYEQAFGNLAYRQGAKRTMRLFERSIRAGTPVERDCHRIAHMIGSATLARDHGDVGRAFAEGSATCASGFYHGILERALVHATGGSGLVATIKALCSGRVVASSAFLRFQCLHGLGHALMIFSAMDLRWSLRMCDRLAGEWAQQSCDGGVFMQNYDTRFGFRSAYLRDDDLLFPCDAVGSRHKQPCYVQVVNRVLPAVHERWPDAVAACNRAERAWRATCFESYGLAASGVSRRNVDELRRLCELVPRKERGACVYGAVRDVVNTDASVTRGVRFCRLVARELRSRCFYGVGTILSALRSDREEVRRICVRVAGPYAPDCELARRIRS
jgi:hypothetical protein